MKVRVTDGKGLQEDAFLNGRAKTLKNHVKTFLYPNAGDFGYGRFLLDAQSIHTVLSTPFEPGSTLLQAQVLEALWESVREAELAPARFLSFAVYQLPKTPDDIALSGLLGRIEAAFRRYLNDAQRDALAVAVERALLEPSATGSRKLLLTRAFIDLAWSPTGLDELKRLLADPQLASRDKFRIIQRLTLRADPQAPALLVTQAAADPGDDGRRYAYAAGAASPAAKPALFKAFLDDPALPESWIEAALGSLNAPEQAALTRPMLGEALARLPELKRKRKIFFVGNWLAAFVGGQNEPGALAEAEAFAQRGGIDADLRLKLLEAMDGLERAVRIRKKFAARSAGD
jgi:aminopeptidase N